MDRGEWLTAVHEDLKELYMTECSYLSCPNRSARICTVTFNDPTCGQGNPQRGQEWARLEFKSVLGLSHHTTLCGATGLCAF